MHNDVCNFADDTTFYVCDNDLVNRLEHDSFLAIEWFQVNYMKLNTDKYHFLLAGYKYEQVWANVGDDKICESQKEKLLGVIIDRNLNFKNHVSNICSRANRKLTALGRLSKLLHLDKKRNLMKSFVESQFAYCPLIWMFHSRELNRKINKFQEKSLRMVYANDTSTYEELLKMDGSVSAHYRNIQTLAIEMYKSKYNLSTDILNNLFSENIYTGPVLRSHLEFNLPRVNTVRYGHNSLRSLGAKIWSLVPEQIKSANLV